MTMKPLKQWICDTCGKLIAKPTHGWLEWRRDKDRRAYGFNIVHHIEHSPRACKGQPRGPSCYQYEDFSMHLHEYEGEDGFALFLSLLDPGPKPDRKYKGPEVDVRAWTEICLRLYLPHYEEARQYWVEAKSDGNESVGETRLYTQDMLKRIIETYGAAAAER